MWRSLPIQIHNRIHPHSLSLNVHLCSFSPAYLNKGMTSRSGELLCIWVQVQISTISIISKAKLKGGGWVRFLGVGNVVEGLPLTCKR